MRPVDSLLFGFLAALGALAAVFVPSPWLVLGGVLAITAVLLASARWAPLGVVHAFLPVPILALLVNVVGPVIESANPARWDAQLAAIDARWFGPLLEAWRGAAGRPAWLTDLASIAYASYYVVPVAAAGVLWARKRFDDFDRYVFALTTTLLASYVAYFIAPATGPRLPEALAGGGAATEALRLFLHTFERNQLDAFPSGHTAVSLVFLAEAWKLFPRLRAPFAAVVAGIIFSTVYLSLHYVVDAAAGVGLALVVLAALPRLRHLWAAQFLRAAAGRRDATT